MVWANVPNALAKAVDSGEWVDVVKKGQHKGGGKGDKSSTNQAHIKDKSKGYSKGKGKGKAAEPRAELDMLGLTLRVAKPNELQSMPQLLPRLECLPDAQPRSE